MAFMDIAFRAELDRHEDPELLELARELCDEHVETRAEVIRELRQLIFERGECSPYRTDDAYLLRFLRARNFVPARAHRLMVRYYEFRAQNRHLWENVDAFGLARLHDIYEGVLHDHPDVGRLIILRMKKWDPSVHAFEDVVRGALALLEIGIMQPKLQVLGGTALVDFEGLSLAQMRMVTPTAVGQMLNILGLGFPTRNRGCHIVNNSRLMDAFFHMFKRVVPAALWQTVHFHGWDRSSLHRHIDPAWLPARYGGHSRAVVPLSLWLDKIKSFKGADFDHDLMQVGYTLKAV